MPASTTNTLSRRERERLMRRRAILDAAQAVFAEKGYQNATLDEIAQRAEFGKGTLYNYFEGGKEEILFAILDRLHDDLCNLIEESFVFSSTEQQSSRAVFRDFLAASFDFFNERQDLFFVLVKEGHQMCFSDEQEKAAHFQKQRERMVGALMKPLQKARDAGAIKDLPLKAVAHVIMGNINGVQAHLALMERGMVDRDEEAVITSSEEAADFLTTMLWDGLQTDDV